MQSLLCIADMLALPLDDSYGVLEYRFRKWLADDFKVYQVLAMERVTSRASLTVL
jgi:hypothetical protein